MAIYTISTCSGYGGLEIALDLAFPETFRPVLYCEYEAAAAANLVTHMQKKAIPAAAIWSNVKTLCSPQCRDYIRERTGGTGIGAITGGYPCQPFSTAGKRAGTKDARHLWPYLVNAIKCYKPELCFFENVSGHLSLGFDVVGRELRDMGYTVAAGLFMASEVGASHKRERLFIMAYRQSNDGRLLLQSRESRQAGDEFERSREELADTSHGGVQGDWAGREQEPCAQIGETLSGRDRLPLFPPGPGEVELWGEILNTDPTLEPAICRMADGSTFRLDDRLRMLGNGIVPVQAAYAFTTLASVLFGDEITMASQWGRNEVQ